MCSYCGCQAEMVISSLTDDHEKISALARDVVDALERGDISNSATSAKELAAVFESHSRSEESGLFHELLLAGEAIEDVMRLQKDHVRFRFAFLDPMATTRPLELKQLVLDLLDHADREETDLFPFALQVLPSLSWNLLEENLEEY